MLNQAMFNKLFGSTNSSTSPSIGAVTPSVSSTRPNVHTEFIALSQTLGPGNWHNDVRDKIASLIARDAGISELIEHANLLTLSGHTNRQTELEVAMLADSALRKFMPPQAALNQPKTVAKLTSIRLGDQNHYPKTEWLIDDVLPSSGLAVAYGPPGSGKSAVALDMCMRVTFGIPWHGRKVRPRKGRPTFYVAMEGETGFGKRMTAWGKHYKNNKGDFFLVPHATNLLDDHEVENLIDHVRSDAPANKPISMVVIDTLAMATPGGDENSGKDMGLFISNCRKIGEELKCLVLVVHHSGKNSGQGARGHSSLLAAADTMLKINDGVITLEKQKDGESNLYWGYELRKVVLKFSKKKEVSSVVAVPTIAAVKKGTSLAKQPKMLLNVLNSLSSICSSNPDLTAAKAEFIRLHTGKPSTASQAFKRALEKLNEEGYVIVNGGQIQISGPL